MTLSAIFRKPIDRPIEGVIKADDDASLGLEVEEYVVTNEIAKRLEDFLGAYTHYEGANGVWISGFFGSGKSHLLKMLALLLEDRDIKGKRFVESADCSRRPRSPYGVDRSISSGAIPLAACRKSRENRPEFCHHQHFLEVFIQ